MTRVAIVRVRGPVNVPKTVNDTMNMLNLSRPNHCVIITYNATYKGMLQKCKDYITWGEIDAPTAKRIIEKRARLAGDKKVTDYGMFKTLDAFVEQFMQEKAELGDINAKKVFRLNPPKKGYKSTKKHFSVGGAIGYRGEKINELLKRMVR